MAQLRTVNAATQQMVETFEGRKLVAYRDVNGHPTIGVGHFDARLQPGITSISDEECDALFQSDMAAAGAAVLSLVKVVLNDNQYGALVDFTFNEGSGHLASSTLLKLLNAGNYPAAAEEFLVWDMATDADGEHYVCEGLLRRRKAEQALFLTPQA